MIRFVCPRCNIVLESPNDHAGSKIDCPRCEQRLQIPLPPLAKTILAPLAPEALRTADWRTAPPPGTTPPPAAIPLQGLEVPPLPTARIWNDVPLTENPVGGQVCCILSCVFGSIAFLFCPPLFGIAGIVLGIIGVCQVRQKTTGIVGITLSTVGMIVGMILGALVATSRH